MKPPFAELFTMFQNASATLKYPKIRFSTRDGNKIQLYLATKGYIAIKFNGEYVGKIPTANSKMVLYPAHMEYADELVAFCMHPLSQSKIHGQEYGHCCFCGLELVNAISVHHGYGPICADKYGLPWQSVNESPIESILIDL